MRARARAVERAWSGNGRAAPERRHEMLRFRLVNGLRVAACERDTMVRMVGVTTCGA